MSGPIPEPGDILVIAPNFKRRLSGVTSTIVQLVPLQAHMLGVVAFGPGLPSHLPKLRLADLPALWRRPRGRSFRIWHARRNVEMLAGIVMRDVLRMPLRLLFTSAAQRRHRVWTKRLIARMDAVIATSAKSAAFLERPATIVLHGIDLKRFAPGGPGDPAAALSGRLVVGCSGRIRPSKGTDLFVEAMLALLPHHPAWTAVVTGRVTAEHEGFGAQLRRQVEAAGLGERVLFVGEVDDVAPWFRRFDLYVAPPRVEGFGLTPLEAMAAGTPVVATDTGAFGELIADGVTGDIVPVGDADALARAIEPYLADPDRRARAAAAGLDRARSHFALEREAAEIGAVYERIWAATEIR